MATQIKPTTEQIRTIEGVASEWSSVVRENIANMGQGILTTDNPLPALDFFRDRSVAQANTFFSRSVSNITDISGFATDIRMSLADKVNTANLEPQFSGFLSNLESGFSEYIETPITSVMNNSTSKLSFLNDTRGLISQVDGFIGSYSKAGGNFGALSLDIGSMRDQVTERLQEVVGEFEGLMNDQNTQNISSLMRPPFYDYWSEIRQDFNKTNLTSSLLDGAETYASSLLSSGDFQALSDYMVGSFSPGKVVSNVVNSFKTGATSPIDFGRAFFELSGRPTETSLVSKIPAVLKTVENVFGMFGKPKFDNLKRSGVSLESIAEILDVVDMSKASRFFSLMNNPLGARQFVDEREGQDNGPALVANISTPPPYEVLDSVTRDEFFNSRNDKLAKLNSFIMEVDYDQRTQNNDRISSVELWYTPSEMNLNMTQSQNIKYTRKGWNIEHWGNELDTMSFSVWVGGFYTNNGLAGWFYKKNTMAYQNLMTIVSLFKNAGHKYRTDDRRRIDVPRRMKLIYDGVTYFGTFDSLEVADMAEQPYKMQISFDFTVHDVMKVGEF